MNNNQYEVALVIGNGFDLNLNLETSYSNYLESNIFQTSFSDAKEGSLKWELFKKYSENKENELKWIDLEVFLKEYFSERFVRETPRKQFEDLVENISLYLKTIELPDSGTYKNKQTYQLLNEIKDKNFIILNFNYTNSVKKILKDLNVDNGIISKRLIHVHGSLDKKNIIVGVDEKFNQLRSTSFLRKISNINFINNNINEIFENSENVVLFGHSLGETDHSYFDDFLINRSKERSNDKKGIFVFYHGSEDWYNKVYEISKLTNDRFKKLRDYNKFEIFDTSPHSKFAFNNEYLVKSPKRLISVV